MSTTIIVLVIVTIFAVVGISLFIIVRRQSDRVERMWQEPRLMGDLRDVQWAEVSFPMDSPVPVPILARIRNSAGSVHRNTPSIMASARKLFFDIHQASLDRDYRKLLSCVTDEMFGQLVSKLVAYGGPGAPCTIDSLTEEVLELHEMRPGYTARVRFSAFLTDQGGISKRSIREVWTIRKESGFDAHWVLSEVTPEPPLSLVKSIEADTR